MEKMLLNFRADEWLVTDLENFKKQHVELESTKDLVQNYIQSLRDKIVSLEATLQYQTDMAGKSAQASLNSSFNQDSSILPTEKESRPTSKPEIIAPGDVQIVTVNGKAYRISKTQKETAIWADGQWTFSQAKAAALAFARELEQVKTEENQKREDAKTAGAIGRARIKEATHNKTSRQPGQGQIEDGCPHGAPVADMVV